MIIWLQIFYSVGLVAIDLALRLCIEETHATVNAVYYPGHHINTLYVYKMVRRHSVFDLGGA